MRLRVNMSGIINGFITAGIAGDGNYGLSIWVVYGLALDWRRVIPHNGLNLNANLSAPSYKCCRLHAGPAAGPAVGTGVRDAGESRRRFLSIDTPQHQHCTGGHHDLPRRKGCSELVSGASPVNRARCARGTRRCDACCVLLFLPARHRNTRQEAKKALTP